MGRGTDIHYETILLQFNCWKPFLQACVRVKIAKFSWGYTAAITILFATNNICLLMPRFTQFPPDM